MVKNKVKLISSNISDKQFYQLYRLFPEVFLEQKIDWDKLKTILGSHLDINIEKFGFSWNGKSNAIQSILIPSKATLKPEKSESVNFNETENLFIEGDNLEVLKLLQKAYFEKIKMIYIDPPYNTGGDFLYKDDFKSPINSYLKQTGQVDEEGNKLTANRETNGRYHSDWLSMMYPRLKLARNLLKEDGVIFVSIDDNEVHHLRMIMNEIFGEENFIGEFVWRKKVGAGSDSKYFFRQHEYILLYAKNSNAISSLFQPLNIEQKREYSNPDNDSRGEWAPTDLSAPSHDKDVKRIYEVISPSGKKFTKCWAYTKDNFSKLVENNLIWWGKNGNSSPKRKRFLKDKEGLRPRSLIDDFLTSEGKKDFSDLDMLYVFDYPKPTSLIKHFLTIGSTNSSDIVLDFFAGSGTTAHAVMALNAEDGGNRKCISVQLPEPTDPKSEAYKEGYKTIADIAKERIRRAGKKIIEEQEGKLNFDKKKLDIGFKTFKLDKSNYPENNFEIDPEKSEEENINAFKDYLERAKQTSLFNNFNEIDVVYENIVKEGLSLNSKIEEKEVAKNKIYIVNDQENTLFICLDKTIEEETVKAFRQNEYKDKTFICLDSALNDSKKANLGLHLELKTI